jgi:ADP-ribose pyrophosphatase YjhB (NUDIX family)
MDKSVPPEKRAQLSENPGRPFSHTPLMLAIRNRVFHIWFMLRRPMTLGVRAVVHDAANRAVLLVRHTYVPGWNFPGGGVDNGETMQDALLRELEEEANIVALEAPRLKSVHFNRHVSRRDHVAVFLIESFEQRSPKTPDSEIAETGFFPIDDLPPDISPGARRRIAEIFQGADADNFW